MGFASYVLLSPGISPAVSKCSSRQQNQPVSVHVRRTAQAVSSSQQSAVAVPQKARQFSRNAVQEAARWCAKENLT